MRVSDNGVQDHRQTAELKGDQIIVTSYVGQKRAASYSFPLSAWLTTLKEFNQSWYQIELLRSLAVLSGDGGAGQGDRILDSQQRAINRLLN